MLSFTPRCGCFPAPAGARVCDGGSLAHDASNIYYLELYRKSVPPLIWFLQATSSHFTGGEIEVPWGQGALS